MSKATGYKAFIAGLLATGAVGAGFACAGVADAASQPQVSISERLGAIRAAALEARPELAAQTPADVNDFADTWAKAFDKSGNQPS